MNYLKNNYAIKNVQTPLGNAEIYLPDEKPVLATILRAGLSMHIGLLNYFDRSESAFVSAYREHINESCYNKAIQKKVIVVTAIATPSAIELVKNQLPTNSEIWVAAIDAELTAQSYIVPVLEMQEIWLMEKNVN